MIKKKPISLGINEIILSKNKKTRIIAYTVIASVYFVTNLSISFFHEAWRDEAQAWTIAKNLSFAEILSLLATEGHLAPWFFILKLWHLAGGQFAEISIISVVIMTIAIVLLITKAPFSIFVKIIIVFSSLFFYYNAVISRCYCIVVLSVAMAAVFRKKRIEKAFAYTCSIAFLLQTHVLMIPLGMALSIEYIIECILDKTKSKLLFGLIPSFSLILSYVELYQGNKPTFRRVTISSLLSNMKRNTILEGLKSILYTTCNYNLFRWITAILVILLVAILLFHAIKSKKRRVIMGVLVTIVGICGYLGIVCLVRKCDHIQMALLFYLMLLFGIWIMIDDIDNTLVVNTPSNNNVRFQWMKNNTLIVLYVAIVAFSSVKEIADIKYDLLHRFSNSKAMAEDIVSCLPTGSSIYVYQNSRLSGVYSYVSDERPDIVFWDVDIGEEYKCYIWGMDYSMNDINTDIYDMPKQSYFLTNTEYDWDYDLVFCENSENAWNENFYLYKLN